MIKNIIDWIKSNPNRTMFLVPIILVAAISISHVVSWYDIANPINWAIYLSVAIEVGAMTALVAATNRIKGGVWFMFGLVTFIQMIGNIFYSYKEIDENGELFRSWVELTGPIWEMFGTDTNDVIGMKRWLSFLEGGLLPIISLTSLHFFTKYESVNEKEGTKSEKKNSLLIIENETHHNPIEGEINIEEKSETLTEEILQESFSDEFPIEDTIEPTTTIDDIKRLKYIK
jgi:hypothetical protein